MLTEAGDAPHIHWRTLEWQKRSRPAKVVRI
jgi:hypothetical protein